MKLPDNDWFELILYARELGLTVDEIRVFLNENMKGVTEGDES
ncbi:DNA-binding anti-repressor SinI [Bacillus gobiensis]